MQLSYAICFGLASLAASLKRSSLIARNASGGRDRLSGDSIISPKRAIPYGFRQRGSLQRQTQVLVCCHGKALRWLSILPI
jgi:hypothetical protein